MTEFIHVDKDATMRRGPDAQRLLEQESDSVYLSAASGITRVPHERWETAQAYEATTWMSEGAHATEDRNSAHRDNFDGYRALQGMRFAHAIEVGCGPFTNLRWIATACRIERCTLLDPLIMRYLSHRHCRYAGGLLRTEEKPLSRLLGTTVAHRALRRAIRAIAPAWLAHGVPVAKTIAAPIEELPPGQRYDLVVMINVIEHCYDLRKIFAAILELLPDGGIFVFSDKYFDHEGVASFVRTYYDAGHPLRVDRGVLSEFMQRNFERLYEKVVPVDERITGETTVRYDEFHFVGRKLPAAGTAAVTGAGSGQP
jgi:SAM-dependent methyltransferase